MTMFGKALSKRVRKSLLSAFALTMLLTPTYALSAERDSTALFYRGVALEGKGDRAGAEASWAEALKNSPTDWPLHAEIARRKFSRSDPK